MERMDTWSTLPGIAEFYSSFSGRPLYHVASQLPPQKMGTILGTIAVLPGKGIVQVVDNKVVGDTGFEPVTSTVCRKDGPKGEPEK
jgi:hypothetical protein